MKSLSAVFEPVAAYVAARLPYSLAKKATLNNDWYNTNHHYKYTVGDQFKFGSAFATAIMSDFDTRYEGKKTFVVTGRQNSGDKYDSDHYVLKALDDAEDSKGYTSRKWEIENIACRTQNPF